MMYLGLLLVAVSVAFCTFTFGIENARKNSGQYSEKPPLTAEEVIRVTAMIAVGLVGGVLVAASLYFG